MAISLLRACPLTTPSGHSEEGWGVRMSNEAADAQRGLIQFVLLDQATADAVIISGWSKADQASWRRGIQTRLIVRAPCVPLSVLSGR